MSARLPEIIAHRGASHEAPENTLSAFRLAWQQRADACECDVQLTQDGHVVIMHDADTIRTTGVKGLVRGRILPELRELEVGAWKARRWTGEKIPTLAAALAILPAGRRMFIEIKSGPETVPTLAETLRRSLVTPEQTAIIGFSLEVMMLAKRALPKVQVYWGVETKPSRSGRVWPVPTDDLIAQTRRSGLDGLDLDASGPIDSDFVARVHAARLKLYVWTVNTAPLARRLTTAGVDGITTDRPAWLHEQVRAARGR